MAVSKLRRQGMVIDRKTGRKRRVDIKRSRTAKRAAQRRRGRKLPGAIRAKISKGIRQTLRHRRTKWGRKLLRVVKRLTTKPYSLSKPARPARSAVRRARSRR